MNFPGQFIFSSIILLANRNKARSYNGMKDQMVEPLKADD